jgi:hypothetical protein
MLTAESNLLTAWNKMAVFTLNERLGSVSYKYDTGGLVNEIIPKFYNLNLHRIRVK